MAYNCFVVGCARSGTTLLASVINCSDDFARYPAETLIMPSSASYGSLSNERGKQRLLYDFLRSRQFKRSGLTADNVKKIVSENSTYSAFLNAFLNSIAAAQGKNRWIDSTPDNHMFLGKILAESSQGKVIYSIRSPMAVVSSLIKLDWTGSPLRCRQLQLVFACRKWNLAINDYCNSKEIWSENIEAIRYEDLVSDFEKTKNVLEMFLDIEIDINKKQDQYSSLSSGNSAYGTRSEGVSKEANDRWKDELNSSERQLISFICRRGINLFYRAEVTNAQESKFFDVTYYLFLTSSVIVYESVKVLFYKIFPQLKKTPFEVGFD